jgi:hypothetical protein
MNTIRTASEVLDTILSCKGSHVSVRYQTFDKPRKESKAAGVVELKRIVKGAFRAGLEFQNLTEIKEAIAKGERGEIQPRKWGVYTKYPFILEHNGAEYVALYPATGGFIQRPKTTYFVNGEETDRATYNAHLTDSDQAKKEKESSGEVAIHPLDLKVSNLLDIICED